MSAVMEWVRTVCRFKSGFIPQLFIDQVAGSVSRRGVASASILLFVKVISDGFVTVDKFWNVTWQLNDIDLEWLKVM